MKNRKLKIVDIGHSKFNLERAGSILETTISQTQHEGEIRVIKVITGHGSGRLRSSIREWCVEQEGRFQAVVFGEDYHMFNKTAVDMRTDGEIKQDSDFGRKNSAITYIWLW